MKLPDHLIDLLAITKTGKDTFFVNQKEIEMNARQFSLWFRKKEIKVGIHKSAHGIRKLSATLLAKSGGTAHELMAFFGWKSISQAEIYTKGADRHHLGIQASELILPLTHK